MPTGSIDPSGLANGYLDEGDILFWQFNAASHVLGYDPTLPQGLVDFVVGMGDNLTFGLTDLIRDFIGGNDAINKCSGFYSAGGWAAVAIDLFTGGALVKGGLKSLKDLKALRDGVRRVRHHTSREALNSIRRQGQINPSRGGGVHVELPPFGSARTAARDTGAFGRGGYVEFDAPGGIIPTHVGPRSTGVIPTNGPLPIGSMNPTYRTFPIWR